MPEQAQELEPVEAQGLEPVEEQVPEPVEEQVPELEPVEEPEPVAAVVVAAAVPQQSWELAVVAQPERFPSDPRPSQSCRF